MDSIKNGGIYKCPCCGKLIVSIGIHDEEGNYHGDLGCEYESDPWSGISYGLHHGGWGDCILCSDGENEPMGGMLFDTAEDAAAALEKASFAFSSDYFSQLKVRLCTAVTRVNDYATRKDLNRNHVNYGEANAIAAVLRDLGHTTDIPVWEDTNGYLRIPKFTIDNWTAEFENKK